jgi:hypothetical protein
VITPPPEVAGGGRRFGSTEAAFRFLPRRWIVNTPLAYGSPRSLRRDGEDFDGAQGKTAGRSKHV